MHLAAAHPRRHRHPPHRVGAPAPNRLGQFFTEWGVRLGRACVGGYCRPEQHRVYVNGKRYTGDPRAILLTDHKEIAIVIGTPPKKIPKTGVFA